MRAPQRFLLLACVLFGLLSATRATPLNENTEWLRAARYGLFMHFLPADKTGLERVQPFDVQALAEQVHAAGAGYLVLTLGQNSGFFNAPNAAYDRRTGYAPGERCAERDLPLDLARALAAKRIRLMLYLPCQTPNGDARAQRAFGLREGPQDQPIDVEFAARWSEVIQEWSDRYGENVAGWWFDGAYDHVGFNEAIAAIYARAAKHGNPKAIVTFNPGVKVIRHTEAEDYTAGELNDPFPNLPTARWVNGSQWHALTYLGSNWGQRDTRFAAERWASWVRAVTRQGGVVTLDVGPNYDPGAAPVGAIAAPQLEQLKVLKAALSGPATVPWDMSVLSNPPAWTALERPKADGVQAISYTGLNYRGKPTRVFAWLGLPKAAPNRKVPAVVLIHGGGGTAFEEWVRLWVSRGYAAIAMDTCGQVPVGNYGRWIRDEQGGPAGWGDFGHIGSPPTDQWTYHAVGDAILAHSLIRSLPEVDPERTGVTGISWGGYLTCIVAGVDQRFKLAVPVYGCGFYHQTSFEGELQKLSPADAERWMAWWDPSVYLGDARMPMLWVTGSNDFAYTLEALQLSYRLAPAPRSLCVRLRMPHGHGGAGENPEEIRVFMDSILNWGTPLLRVTGSGQDGAAAWATFEGKVPLHKAELNYTRETGRWQDRTWESIPARESHGRITAELPRGTRAFYFNLFDRRDCVVSTEHALLDGSAAQPAH